MTLGFVRVRIGVALLNDEDGWRVVAQQGDEPAKVMPGSFTDKDRAMVAARRVARAYEAQLDERKIPWGKT